ncbi:MAG: energy-coupling factor ABC transporter ATP-binding protein [Calditerrivibrio sp.]|nr:energy-coupling factor ABC transporter ATP-binding protein [Calditerrivibrio sp.]
MSHHFIEVSNISYTYPDGTKVLHNISFRLEHGDALAVLGANGAGKSTLLKHLNGTILCQEGSINIGGIFISKDTLKIVRTKVGIVFQNTDNQLFMPTVYDNIAFGLDSLGFTDQQIKEIVYEICNILSINHLKDKHPFKLSGGEKRKVCIASALAFSPEILVLDEPTAELDPKSSFEIANILNDFKHTKIIATHNLTLAQKLCNKCLILSNGNILYFGNYEDLQKNEEILIESNLLIR